MQCAPTGLPLRSKWATAGARPNPQSLPRRGLDPEALGMTFQGRVTTLEQQMTSLRAEWPQMLERVRNVRTMADCAAGEIATAEHLDLIAYVLYSLYAQLRIENRMGHNAAIVDWFRTAAGNVLGNLTGYVMEATHV